MVRTHLFRTFWVAAFASLLGGTCFATQTLQVVARVGNHVITDRRVVLSHYLEQPETYLPGARGRELARTVFEQSMQRLLTQIMVAEENRILGTVRVENDEIQEAVGRLKKSLRDHWSEFLEEFELSESTLKPLLEDQILLEKNLSARARAVKMEKDDEGVSREQKVRESLQEWLTQLRSRYRVQIFRNVLPEQKARS